MPAPLPGVRRLLHSRGRYTNHAPLCNLPQLIPKPRVVVVAVPPISSSQTIELGTVNQTCAANQVCQYSEWRIACTLGSGPVTLEFNKSSTNHLPTTSISVGFGGSFDIDVTAATNQQLNWTCVGSLDYFTPNTPQLTTFSAAFTVSWPAPGHARSP